MMSGLLEKINCPHDLKSLDYEQLTQLCEEIRERLISVVSENGGHLASNLGVVELTVALHKVFDSPNDCIIFDVGHQTYVHKLLTGRRERFDTLRIKDGISGFSRPDESRHDPIIAGHASAALSKGLGIARAKLLNNDKGKVVVVIGDGAFAGGMVYEALNNISEAYTNLVVILNDNSMSISKSVGSFSKYLTHIRTKRGNRRIKKKAKKALNRIPYVGSHLVRLITKQRQNMRQRLYKGTLFEDFGLTYVGALDGHRLKELIATFDNLTDFDEPVLVHIKTQKGKGYPLAEDNPGAYHGVSTFTPKIDTPDIALANSFSNVFGRTLCELAEQNDRICAITAAMKYATGLNHFAKQYPERFFDVGITESHGVAFAAGLAEKGLVPFVAIYSTFMQRAYDQIIHDVMLEQLPIVFAVDRAGLVGDDGETHQGIYDAAFFSQFPNLSIFAPVNYSELHETLSRCVKPEAPVVIRYPRGGEDDRLTSYKDTGNPFDCFFTERPDLLIVTYGRILAEVDEAAKELKKQGIYCDILKLNLINPVNDEAITIARRYSRILFVEEGIRQGGIGEHYLANLLSSGYSGRYDIAAVETNSIRHMKVKEQLALAGLDATSLIKRIQDEVRK